MKSKKKKRKKVAILGGGLGALTTAFELTNTKKLRKRYEITVYQMGWRLGGKGASGRNRDIADRVEEHGVHVFLGFYENAFRVVRKCFAELDRPESDPLSTALAAPNPAFRAHDHVTLMEEINGKWLRWELPFPATAGWPGDEAMRRNNDLPESSTPTAAPWNLFNEVLRWLVDYFDDTFPALAMADTLLTPKRRDVPQRARRSQSKQKKELRSPIDTLLHGAFQYAATLGATITTLAVRHLDIVGNLLERYIDRLYATLKDQIPLDHQVRRFWIVMRLGVAVLLGMIKDGVLVRGFDVIDDCDFTEWLRRHGATSRDVWWSAPVRSIYSLVIAFEPKDTEIPNFAAGTALRGMLRLFFDYKGALMWKMQAGMGDTIVAPLYQVLKKRGVKFKFFHRVEQLRLSKGNKFVNTVELGVQAEVKKGREYKPLFDVVDASGGRLACWPSEPDYDQLDLTTAERKELRRLKRSGVDPFESAWSPRPARQSVLRRGRDFDIVVLGISIGALPHICQKLVGAKGRWRKMVKHIKTVQTQAYQLWLTENWNQLGWKSPTFPDARYEVPPRAEEPMSAGFKPPFDNYVGMSQLLERETWSQDIVKHIAYFYAPLQDAANIPPFNDSTFPVGERDRVKAAALNHLKNCVQAYWPAAYDFSGFRWDLLVDMNNASGEGRFDAQYCTANINPSDRYVLAVRGSSKYRLRSDESGFANLLLAGDWTRTGLNAGCAEAATMSGMQAARAICGFPKYVIGETDFDENPLTRELVKVTHAGAELGHGATRATSEGLKGFKERIDEESVFHLDAQRGVVGGIGEGSARLLEGIADTIRKTRKQLTQDPPAPGPPRRYRPTD